MKMDKILRFRGDNSGNETVNGVKSISGVLIRLILVNLVCAVLLYLIYLIF
jgi:hypothetical protein